MNYQPTPVPVDCPASLRSWLRIQFQQIADAYNNVSRMRSYKVSELPTGKKGDSAIVTDALAPAFNAAVVGGGAVTVPVYYNGSAWTVG